MPYSLCQTDQKGTFDSPKAFFIMNTYDALSLFSGGLDSIVATKLMQSLGFRVLGLHCTSPFFGKPERVQDWWQDYGIPVRCLDVGQEFVDLMAAFPAHGFGKVLNPCVDCKIFMLRRAKVLLSEYGARFLISGEVLGQRPMSQRADTLNTIRNEAAVRDVLLRPLSAGLLDPTPMEESGLVDRTRLASLSGRGRKGQFALAKALGITKIPAQAGGCRLGEQESARRYWPILRTFPRPLSRHFALANIGRQLWRREAEQSTGHWLVMGRVRADNERLAELLIPEEYAFELESFPGPLAVGSPLPGHEWDKDILLEAAACLASFSPKARVHGKEVPVLVSHAGAQWRLAVRPDAAHGFTEPLGWSETRQKQKAWAKECQSE